MYYARVRPHGAVAEGVAAVAGDDLIALVGGEVPIFGFWFLVFLWLLEREMRVGLGKKRRFEGVGGASDFSSAREREREREKGKKERREQRR